MPRRLAAALSVAARPPEAAAGRQRGKASTVSWLRVKCVRVIFVRFS